MIMSNTTTIQLIDGREILLSYGVPVAAFIPDWLGLDGNRKPSYIKTARKFSVTTSRHANSYAGDGATMVDDAVFCKLITPIDPKR